MAWWASKELVFGCFLTNPQYSCEWIDHPLLFYDCSASNKNPNYFLPKMCITVVNSPSDSSGFNVNAELLLQNYFNVSLLQISKIYLDYFFELQNVIPLICSNKVSHSKDFWIILIPVKQNSCNIRGPSDSNYDIWISFQEHIAHRDILSPFSLSVSPKQAN